MKVGRKIRQELKKLRHIYEMTLNSTPDDSQALELIRQMLAEKGMEPVEEQGELPDGTPWIYVKLRRIDE